MQTFQQACDAFDKDSSFENALGVYSAYYAENPNVKDIYPLLVDNDRFNPTPRHLAWAQRIIQDTYTPYDPNIRAGYVKDGTLVVHHFYNDDPARKDIWGKFPVTAGFCPIATYESLVDGHSIEEIINS